MPLLKKVVGDVEVNKDLLLLLIIGGLYALAISISNSFVNVYLWKQTREFSALAIYNLVIVIFQPLTFILAGRWAKKIDRVVVLRLGVSFLSVFYIVVLMVGDRADEFLILLGALLGIGYGFYWLAFNVLTFEITEPDTRDFFNGFLGVLNSFAGMIGPLGAGFIIASLYEYIGYRVVFGVSLLMFVCAVVLSFFLQRRPAEGVYKFREVLRERKYNRDWRRILYAHVFQGIREGTFIFVVSVLVFITTDSELALGTFGLVNSAVAFVAYYVASRFIKQKDRLKFIFAGGILLYGSVFLLLFNLTYTNLILYAICIAIGYPILLVPYMSLTYDVIGRAKDIVSKRIEYIVVRDVFLNIGRIISIGSFLIAVVFFNEQQSLPILLAVIGAGHCCIYFCVRNISQPTNKHTPKPVTQPALNEGDGESPA
ncbi:MFS transporter [Priestia flexa]|uniref:MFS transporter n=1 Tax=Priestia flexa TaxID=86664 RepID=UPI00240E4E0C|nr:MFS transporter [Priestia flexa]WEZ09529.1 MFS transporter [Priestia flexa]